MKSTRVILFTVSSFFFLMAGFIIFISVMANSEPSSGAYMMIAMGVMAFCVGYLYPQFKQKDERMKLIREKGMFVSFIAIMGYFLIFNFGLQFEFFTLTANELLHILSALFISTVFISFVVLSKIY
jgi:hypothetical protein